MKPWTFISLAAAVTATAFPWWFDGGPSWYGVAVVIGFALAPLYGLMHIGLLIWMRLYSPATIRPEAGVPARASRSG